MDKLLISPSISEMIRQKAQEIWEIRQETGQHLIFDKGELREINAQDDWLEAEDAIIRELRKEWR